MDFIQTEQKHIYKFEMANMEKSARNRTEFKRDMALLFNYLHSLAMHIAPKSND